MEGYEWDEDKRLSNLLKHGLDFRDAWMVLESRFRMDTVSYRNGEKRVESKSYVFDVLRVLLVVHCPTAKTRVISFRIASKEERRDYIHWLENHDHDAGRDESGTERD